VTSHRPTHVLGINAYHGDVSAALVRDGILIAAVEGALPADQALRGLPDARHSVGAPSGWDPRHGCRSCRGESRSARAPPAQGVVHAGPTAQHSRSCATDCGTVGGWATCAGRSPLRSRCATRHCHRSIMSNTTPRTWPAPSSSHRSATRRAARSTASGDFVSTSFALGSDTHIDVLDHVFFPHSLGILYTAVTQHLGSRRSATSFKVMGLAPYGGRRWWKRSADSCA